jgi:hypothetical protein
MNKYVHVLIASVLGFIMGIYGVLFICNRDTEQLLSVQEKTIFEKYAQDNYGTMKVEVTGQTEGQARQKLADRVAFLRQNNWSMVGEITIFEEFGLVKLTQIATRFP